MNKALTTTLAASVLAAFVAPPVLAEGEVYAGIVIGHNDEPSYHLVLLPGQKNDVVWKDADAWAKSIGGELPNRREGHLLIANLKHEFDERAYWLSESEGKWKWCQSFDGGGQACTNVGHELRARAVRRFSV